MALKLFAIQIVCQIRKMKEWKEMCSRIKASAAYYILQMRI